MRSDGVESRRLRRGENGEGGVAQSSDFRQMTASSEEVLTCRWARRTMNKSKSLNDLSGSGLAKLRGN